MKTLLSCLRADKFGDGGELGTEGVEAGGGVAVVPHQRLVQPRQRGQPRAHGVHLPAPRHHLRLRPRPALQQRGLLLLALCNYFGFIFVLSSTVCGGQQLYFGSDTKLNVTADLMDVCIFCSDIITEGDRSITSC